MRKNTPKVDLTKKGSDAGLLIQADYIIGVGPGAALVVKDGKVLDAGPTPDLSRKHQGVATFDASGHILMPGLINNHIHAPMGFFRDLGHGKQNMIESFLFPAEKALTPDLIKPLSYSYLVDALSAGVTTVAEHYYFSDGVCEALTELGMRGFVGETIADLGGAFPSKETWSKTKANLERWPHGDLVRPVVAPHAMDTVSPELMREVSLYAADHDLHLHMHLSQTESEWKTVLKHHQKTPVALAAECGALGSKTLAVHLLHLGENDLKVLKETGTHVGYCPSSQLLYERSARINDFYDADLSVLVGTDCAASCDHADVLSEARLAAFISIAHNSELRLRETKWFFDSVCDRAYQFWFGQAPFTAGAPADIVFVERGLLAEPVQDPLNNLFFSATTRRVRHVMIAGKFCLWDRQVTNLDMEDAALAYEKAVNKIKQAVSM